VDWTYTLPFKFTGRIAQVTVEVFPEAAPKAGKAGTSTKSTAKAASGRAEA